MSTGWQASCAASGTPSTIASGVGITRAMAFANGPASSNRPAVAQTERAKP